jgi:hypothetical protein
MIYFYGIIIIIFEFNFFYQDSVFNLTKNNYFSKITDFITENS